MALTRITKGVIKPNENYDTHNINSTGIVTAIGFKGPFTGSSDIQSGIITATKIDLNGDIDVDGHTNLDNVSIAGVTTAAGAIDLNADLDVDGHTNLDNVSIAGVTTFAGAISGTTASFSGNVSIGGTLTYEDVTNIDSVGILTARQGIKIPDDNKSILLGESEDMRIRHTGSHSEITDEGTGHLRLGGGQVRIGDPNFSNLAATFDGTGQVKLNYANVEKLTTASSGVNIVGTTTTGQLAVTGISTFSGGILANAGVTITDNQYLNLGAHNGSDARLWHDNSGGGHTYLFSYHSSGVLKIADDTNVILGKTTNYNYINCTPTTTELFAGGNKKFWTTSTGAELTGTMNIANSAGQSHYQITQASGNTVKFGIVSGSDIELSGSSNNSMYFKTNNTERLRIASGGAIGINTSVPSTAQDLTFDGASNYKAGILYKQAGVNQYRFMCEGGTGHVYYDTFVNDRDHIFRVDSQSTGGTPVFRIGGDGKVSVGTEQTTHTFGVTGGSSSQLLVKGTEADIWLHSTGPNGQWRIIGSTGNTTHQFRIYDNTGGADRLVIDSQGRLSCGPGAETGSLSSSLHVRRNQGGTAAGESVIAATMGDNTTMNNALLTVRNAGNRGSRGHGAGSKLASFEFNDKNALTIDKSGLVQIGGAHGVGGTWHHSVYNDSGTCSVGIFGTQGAWFQLQDTGSSENFVLAANGDCNLYSYKNDDSICFNTTTGGTTTQMLKLLGDGNIRWFPDGSTGVNLHMTSGTSSVVFAANKDGSVGTSWHFKNQNSSGQARTWMEVSDAQCVAMPYAMGGTNILNLYNTTGRDGLNIFANVSSGNQNSDAGAITFNGYAQTNGAWIQGTNELAWAKKDLLLGTSYGTGNNYDTRDWDKPVQRLTYGGWIGMKEAATTNAAVKSLLHIKGTSVNGSADATLTIEDSDTTAGSKEPIIAFDGNGTRQGRIMSSDQTSTTNSSTGGLYFGVGSSNDTVLQCTGMKTVRVHNDVRGWATVEYNSIRQHTKMFYSPGNAVATHTILRIRRYWWGWGNYKIRCKAIYYNSSLESTYYVNGHGSGGNSYSISNETFGGSASSNSWNCTVTHTASNNSPGGGSPNVWYADVQVNIPNYYYVTVWVEAWGSSYSTDPTSMHYDSYCLM